MHGFELDRLSCPALWEVTGFLLDKTSFILQYLSLFFCFLFVCLLSLYFISLLPKTPCLGEHSFDFRGKTALPLQNKGSYVRKHTKDITYGDKLSVLFWHRMHVYWLILFPKCSSVISCARILFSPLARNFFKGKVHNFCFFYSVPQTHSTVCSSCQDAV